MKFQKETHQLEYFGESRFIKKKKRTSYLMNYDMKFCKGATQENTTHMQNI